MSAYFRQIVQHPQREYELEFAIDSTKAISL